MIYIVFKSTRPAVTRFTTAALLLLALAACNAGGDSEEGQSFTFNAIELYAKGVNQGIDLSWVKVTGAKTYTVYYHTDRFASSTARDGEVKSQKGIAATSTSIGGLINSTTYYLLVEAINKDGNILSASRIVSATANLPVPTKLKATGRNKAIDLSWGKVEGATSYTVYYSKAGFDKTADSRVTSKTAITTNFTSITGLAEGTTYFFGVIAINSIGDNSKMSPIQSATTKLLALHPSAAASINSLAAVDLIWNPVAGATNYKIYYAKVSLDGLGYKDYLTVGGKYVTIDDTDTRLTIGDLSADTTYYFVVAANYVGGKEATAPEVSADTSYIAELAMGGKHGCVRSNTGRIKCWGNNEKGQLGLGEDGGIKKTATSVSGIRAKQLSAGDDHSCAIDLSGKLYCWGSNDFSQLGLEGGDISSPTKVEQTNLAKVSLVSAGSISTCALAGNHNYCWGNQGNGGLGNGIASGDTKDAQPINNITREAKQFAVGYWSSCAIDASDDLWCWGWNQFGQVGDDTTTDRPNPVKPKIQGENSKATMLAGKYFHYCAVDNASKVQCWGNNGEGRLGINSGDNSNRPQYVLASRSKTNPVHLEGVSKIATGNQHSCAIIAEDGKVRCWGYSDSGRIGTDGEANRLVANADMQGINNAIDIAAGADFTCALLEDKAMVKCWGANGSGQLGDGTTKSSSKPVAVAGLTAITKLPPISIPTPPTKLQATGKNKAIDLTWGAVTGAISYTVYYHTASFDKTTVSLAKSKTVIAATGTSITGLKNGTEYFIRLVASNTKGDSGLSEIEVSATTELPAPTKLQAISKNKAVDLTWDAVTGATSYTVYYSKESFDNTYDSGVQSTTDDIEKTNTSITGLDNGQTYYFRVVAYIGSVSSQPSIAAIGTPNLSRPTGLEASSGYESVALSWDMVPGVDGYWVYYDTSAGVSPSKNQGDRQIKGDAAIKTVIRKLKNNTKYYFVIVAYQEGSSNSQPSSPVSATPNLAPPEKLHAVSGEQEAVTLSWDIKYGVDGYLVYYHTSDDVSPLPSNRLGYRWLDREGKTSVKIEGLTGGQIYHFVVVANKGSSSSSPSTKVFAVPSFAPPTNLNAIGVIKAIDLSWDAVTGATSYTVYYHTALFDKTSDSGVKSKTGIKTNNTRIKDLANGITYYFRVVASNASASSKMSLIQSATANLPAPDNLNATGVNQGINLSWDKVKAATSYTVYYSEDSSFDSTSGSGIKSKTGITTTNTIIKGLANGTTYYFRVIAINASVSSAMSPIQSATTKLVAPHHPSAAASIISPAAVDLSWDTVVGVTNYKIYYAKQSLDDLIGGYKNYARAKGHGTRNTEATSITIGDLSADTTYYFVVAANYKVGEDAAPELTADSSYIAELAMGGYHGCVRLNTGGIKCWGRNSYGQLGLDDIYDKWTATSVPGMLAKQLTAGVNHSCAIGLSDSLYCWGANGQLQLGLEDSNRYRPTLVKQDKLDTVSLVSAGQRTTCALADGNNYCWGDQYFGGLGNGFDRQEPIITAQKIKDITPDVRQFAVGSNSGCAIDASNDLWCWGNNKYGQVGDGKDTNRASPVKPKLQGSSFATMVAGRFAHYCVVDKANKAQCWGRNDSGQLGIGSTADKSTRPQYVLDSTPDSHLSNVSKVATGFEHSCALIVDGSADRGVGGKVRCWGWSDYGITGIDPKNAANRLVADTDMPGIKDAIDIAAGYSFTCVLLADKARVKCWGKNGYGQLGNGKTDYSYMPVAVKWK